jgi:hypothetical protein
MNYAEFLKVIEVEHPRMEAEAKARQAEASREQEKFDAILDLGVGVGRRISRPRRGDVID